MRSILLVLVIALPASATTLDTQKLERLLGLGHTTDRPPPPVAPSPLPWRLLGTLRARDGVSFAAVECSAKSVTLAVGDVRDGVEVIAIEQQLLIVRRAGRLEEVSWKLGVPSAPAALLPAAHTLPRQAIQAAFNNPNDILGQVQLLPAMVGGKLTGFKARWVKEGSLVSSLGLKTGDTIIKVNGAPLDSMERVMGLMQLLTTTQRFEVELERNGQRLVESVELGN